MSTKGKLAEPASHASACPKLTHVSLNVETRDKERGREKEENLDKPGTPENTGEAENIQGGKYCKYNFKRIVKT